MKTPFILYALVVSAICFSCARDAAPHIVEPVRPEEPSGLVGVGEATASAAGAGPTTAAALREALRDAARALNEDPRITRSLVIDGGVSHIDHEHQDEGNLLTVAVTLSLSVRDAEGGQILVVLEGTGEQSGAAPQNEAELQAIEGEVIVGTLNALIDQLGPTLDQAQR